MGLRGMLIAAIAIAGCAAGVVVALDASGGGKPVGPDPVVRQWPDWTGKVTCGSIPFDPLVAFSRPPDAAEGDRPAEAAFRRFLEAGGMTSGEAKPLHGWRLLGETGAFAEFANGRASDGRLKTWTVGRHDGSWQALGFSSACQPKLRRDGREAITWTLARGQQLTSTTTRIRVDLGSGECAGGKGQDERLEKPAFREEKGDLLMALWIRPVPPLKPHEAYSCVGTIEPPVTIQLPAPLGERELLDGGVFPPLSSAQQQRRDEGV